LRRRHVDRDQRRRDQRNERDSPQRQRMIRLVCKKLNQREHAERAECRQQCEPAARQVLRDVEVTKLLLEESVETQSYEALVQLIRVRRLKACTIESRPLHLFRRSTNLEDASMPDRAGGNGRSGHSPLVTDKAAA